MNIFTKLVKLTTEKEAEHEVKIIELDAPWYLILDPHEGGMDNTELIKLHEANPAGDIYLGARKGNLYQVKGI
jgi:hypothetical protein